MWGVIDIVDFVTATTVTVHRWRICKQNIKFILQTICSNLVQCYNTQVDWNDKYKAWLWGRKFLILDFSQIIIEIYHWGHNFVVRNLCFIKELVLWLWNLFYFFKELISPFIYFVNEIYCNFWLTNNTS